jgi:hypothetical protein
MRQECAMTTVDNLAVLEQVEGGFVVCPLSNINIVHYPGCPPYPTYPPLTCPPLPGFPPV